MGPRATRHDWSDVSQELVLVVSSKWTALSRLSFVPLSIFSAAVFALAYATNDASLLLVGSAFGVAGVVHCLRFAPIKAISIHGDIVTASSLRHTITFPISAILDIEVRRFRPNYAYMHLNQRTPFGFTLRFLPRGTTFRGANPIVDAVLLRARAVASFKSSTGAF